VKKYTPPGAAHHFDTPSQYAPSPPPFSPATPTTPSTPSTTSLNRKLSSTYKQAVISTEIEGYARHRSVCQGFYLTLSLLLLYFSFCVAFYSHWNTGPLLSTLDSLLFAVTTITTVGYGVGAPTTQLGYGITSVVILFGVGLLVITVAVIYQLLGETLYRVRQKADLSDSAVFNKLRRSAKNSDQISRINNSFREFNLETNRRGVRRCFQRMVTTMVEALDSWSKLARKYRITHLAFVLLPFVLLTAVGASVVGHIQELTFLESLYWAIVTLSTVGYGDIALSDDSAKVFALFYIPFSLVFMSMYLALVASVYITFHERNIKRIVENLYAKWDIRDSPYAFEEDGRGAAAAKPPQDELFPTLPLTINTNLYTPESTTRTKTRTRASNFNSTFSSPDLRGRVQSRLQSIVAQDIVGCSRSIAIDGDNVIVSIDGLSQVMDKWLMPRGARRSFRATSYSAMLEVGMTDFESMGAYAFEKVDAVKLGEMFAPLLACMGSMTVMEGWLRGADLIAEMESRGEERPFASTTSAKSNTSRVLVGHLVTPKKRKEALTSKSSAAKSKGWSVADMTVSGITNDLPKI
jgi:voltage-gated potassium channel Kch